MSVARRVRETTRHDGRMRLRMNARFVSGLRVRCIVRETGETTREVVGHTGNIGVRGVLAWLPEALAPRTELPFHLELPLGTVTAIGKVTWRDDDEVKGRLIAHGVRLVRFAQDADRMQYHHFLSRLAAGTPANPSLVSIVRILPPSLPASFSDTPRAHTQRGSA